MEAVFNITLPTSWAELSDKQLLMVYGRTSAPAQKFPVDNGRSSENKVMSSLILCRDVTDVG